ncbi:MAG: hypothetical protein ACO1O6_06080 [Bacteroidota bacterium]
MLRSLFLFLLVSPAFFAQDCSQLNFQQQSETASICAEMTMTMLHDRNDRPYLYVANKTAGLKIYDISDLSNPDMVKQIPVSGLLNLDVMSLSQSGNYLYLALGNSFSAGQESGAAIIDISDPGNAFVTDNYSLSGSSGGSGIIQSEGDYAYLGAMGNGIVVLNVADKSNIQFVSQFIPELEFPDPIADTAKINARGMEVRNDTIFLCYDAGGFRIIDAANKSQLTETGRYSNPLLNGLPRAYNNLVLDGNLAYITVDYCGVEVIDFSDPSNPILHGWWNPYNCPGNNWFSSPSHANEIRLSESCDQLFVSTGKSDLVILDISDPSQPDSCNFFGGISNNTGTWGVDLYENKVFLSYVCAFIPFASLWTGFKTLTYTPCSNSLEEKPGFLLGVHAASKQIRLGSAQEISQVEIFTILGQKIPYTVLQSPANELLIQLECNNASLYFIRISGQQDQQTQIILF